MQMIVIAYYFSDAYKMFINFYVKKNDKKNL